MTTLLHTSEGISPMHEIVEEQMEQQADDSWAVEWEALRLLSVEKGGSL